MLQTAFYAVLMFITGSELNEQCFIAKLAALNVDTRNTTDRRLLRTTLLAERNTMVAERMAAVQKVLDKLRSAYSGPAALLRSIGANSNWPQSSNPAGSPECFDDDMRDLQRLQ